MARLIFFILLLWCSTTSATTYHTRFMADFDAPAESSALYLFTQIGNSQWSQWYFDGSGYIDTTYTTKTEAWPGYLPFRFAGIYYDDTTGYQPILSEVTQWYADTAPVFTINNSNYWTTHHVTTHPSIMYVPYLNQWPLTLRWETWATVDPTAPSEGDNLPVPEPSTALLLVLGAIIISSFRLFFRNQV